ncbi:MAG: hypothetical protein AB1817_12650 [Chloroflexota bacterium]
MRFEKILQSVSEQLYGDEKLRSNLTDDEASVVLNWASRWIEEQISAATGEANAKQIALRAFAQAREAVSAINALASRSGAVRIAEAVAALEPLLQIDQKTPRVHVFKLLTTLLGAAWSIAPRQSKTNR